jgi:RNA polymerase sigma-70 factor (ECF subfamily)
MSTKGGDVTSYATAGTGPKAASRVAADPNQNEIGALMARYARGEDAAFSDLYRALAPRLRMFLLRLCGRSQLADDMLQETFLRIHRARGSFSDDSSPLPWVYAIARNVCVDHARKGVNRVSSDGVRDSQPSLEAEPDRVAAAREELAQVRTTLAKLPPHHREAFVLLRFEEMSVAEAARVLGTSESNVKVRAFRAYEAFREALGRTKSA